MSVRPRERLLDELGRRLVCNARTRRKICAELEEHVTRAVEEGDDESVAVARLGDPELLAALFNEEALHQRETRREARTFAVLSLVSMAAIASMFIGPVVERTGNLPSTDETRAVAPPGAVRDPKTLAIVRMLPAPTPKHFGG